MELHSHSIDVHYTFYCLKSAVCPQSGHFDGFQWRNRDLQVHDARLMSSPICAWIHTGQAGEQAGCYVLTRDYFARLICRGPTHQGGVDIAPDTQWGWLFGANGSRQTAWIKPFVIRTGVFVLFVWRTRHIWCCVYCLRVVWLLELCKEHSSFGAHTDLTYIALSFVSINVSRVCEQCAAFVFCVTHTALRGGACAAKTGAAPWSQGVARWPVVSVQFIVEPPGKCLRGQIKSTNA